MCFYARRDFKCGDWRWGNMMERCPRQHRIGETCGAKLVHDDYREPVDEKCRICQDIEVKKRKLSKTQDNILRWRSQKGSFAALLEKAETEEDELCRKIELLNAQRESVRVSGRPVRASDSPMPPLESMTTSSYTWSSQPTTSRAYGGLSTMTSGYESVSARSGSGREGLTASRQISLPYRYTSDRHARHAR